jgi:nucleoside-diphosphate-sugar epimerase
MVLHLLARGQSPESIRIIDFVPPRRADMLQGQAAHVEYVHADITSEEMTRAAFDRPWAPSVANLPLTVLHPAAVINFTDRARTLLYKVNGVNLTGTANVLSAAKRAGADVFLATSSASVAIKAVNYWLWPWQRHGKNFFQLINEDDAQRPLRDHSSYFGNYAVSKAHAEKLVMAANSEHFRTGCIRPANGIYGTRYDQTVGTYLSRKHVPT